MHLMLNSNPNANSETKKNADLISYLTILLIVYPVFLIILIVFNVHKWGELGNFGSLLSGTLGPFVTAITGVLLYSSIKEQRIAFIEQSKANQISLSNQAFSVIINEITNIEKDRENDLKFLKDVLDKFPTLDQKWEHDTDEMYTDEDGEVKEKEKDKFMRLKDIHWLKLIAITQRLVMCFSESKKLRGFNDFPFNTIHRIYVINEYRFYMNNISLKLKAIQSKDDKEFEDSFIKLFDKLEALVAVTK